MRRDASPADNGRVSEIKSGRQFLNATGAPLNFGHQVIHAPNVGYSDQRCQARNVGYRDSLRTKALHQISAGWRACLPDK